MRFLYFVVFIYFVFSSSLLPLAQGEGRNIRVGHFSNITHPQGVIGHFLSESGKGWFEKWLGSDISVQWYVYRGGSSAIEALLAGSIDLLYVGPVPAINAYIRMKNQEIQVICGACNNGAALVVRSGSGIETDADFKGKSIATPQIGNTQDVSARAWLKGAGYVVKLKGGDVNVVPTANGDQLRQFLQKHLDGAWTVEPWVTFLEMYGNGKLYFEESALWPQTQGEYATTLLVTKQSVLYRKTSWIKQWLKGHVALTQWIEKHPDQAKKIVAEEIERETRVKLPMDVLDKAWKRIRPSWDPMKISLTHYAKELYEIKFLQEEPNVSSLCNVTFLNAILDELHLKHVE